MTHHDRLSRLVAFAATLSLLFLSLVSISSADQTSQWPTAWTKFRLFQDNNAVWNDGVSAAAKWKTHVSATIIGDASIVNNVVYVGTNGSLYIGTMKGDMLAIPLHDLQ